MRRLGDHSVQLLRLVAELGSPTNADLASRVGWTRARVGGAMSALRRLGYVRTANRAAQRAPFAKHVINTRHRLTRKGGDALQERASA